MQTSHRIQTLHYRYTILIINCKQTLILREYQYVGINISHAHTTLIQHTSIRVHCRKYVYIYGQFAVTPTGVNTYPYYYGKIFSKVKLKVNKIDMSVSINRLCTIFMVINPVRHNILVNIHVDIQRCFLQCSLFGIHSYGNNSFKVIVTTLSKLQYLMYSCTNLILYENPITMN